MYIFGNQRDILGHGPELLTTDLLQFNDRGAEAYRNWIALAFPSIYQRLAFLDLAFVDPLDPAKIQFFLISRTKETGEAYTKAITSLVGNDPLTSQWSPEWCYSLAFHRVFLAGLPTFGGGHAGHYVSEPNNEESLLNAMRTAEYVTRERYLVHNYPNEPETEILSAPSGSSVLYAQFYALSEAGWPKEGAISYSDAASQKDIKLSFAKYCELLGNVRGKVTDLNLKPLRRIICLPMVVPQFSKGATSHDFRPVAQLFLGLSETSELKEAGSGDSSLQDDEREFLQALALHAYRVYATSTAERFGRIRGRLGLSHSLPYAISASINKIIEVEKAVKQFKQTNPALYESLPSEVRSFSFPIELYQSAVDAALLSTSLDQKAFEKSVPHIPYIENALRERGIDKDLLSDISNNICLKLAQLRLERQDIYMTQGPDIVINEGMIPAAEMALKDNTSIAAFISVIISIIKEAIQHTCVYYKWRSEGGVGDCTNTTAGDDVHIEIASGEHTFIEVSNPCRPDTNVLNIHSGFQEQELQFLAPFLPGWKIRDAKVINSTWTRRIERVG